MKIRGRFYALLLIVFVSTTMLSVIDWPHGLVLAPIWIAIVVMIYALLLFATHE